MNPAYPGICYVVYPHFVAPTPATTNGRSNISNGSPSKVDITKLDMKNPEHRKVYADYRKTAGLA